MKLLVTSLVWAYFPLLLTSCATFQRTPKPSPSAEAQVPSGETAAVGRPYETVEKGELKSLPESSHSHEAHAAAIENYTIGEIIRSEEPNTQSLYDNSRYDFPITMNSRVEGWIEYFTGRGRNHMERYLARSSRYIPLMKQILKREGLPEDLVYLALIESGFNLRAKSRARAVGAWQFMKATGKRYGLRVDAWIDERRDFVRSTEAAARYLKDLYLMFESWYLAASAYNAGEYKILRAIDELKTNNYWRICETRLLRRETKDYIPKLIAAAIIAKNPNRYGFEDVVYQDPLQYEAISVDFPVHLREIAKLVDADQEEIEDLNPELVRSMVPPDADTYELRVPQGSRVLVEQAVSKIRTQLASDDLPRQHTVSRGDTLHSVSRKYRVTVKELANVNNMSPKEKLSPGASLVIPKRGRREASIARVKRSVTARELREESAGGFLTHVVRRGESLWSISEKYDVTVQEIFRWNNLRRSRIHPGKKLKIKGRSGGTEQATESSSRVQKKRSRIASSR